MHPECPDVVLYTRSDEFVLLSVLFCKISVTASVSFQRCKVDILRL